MDHRLAGALCLAFFALHAGHHVLRGHPADALWICNVGAALTGLGLLLRQPSVVAVGTTWVACGTPLWLADLAAGGEFVPTTLGTHFGALALGVDFFRRAPWPAGSAWRALAGFVVLHQVCLRATPAEANVNMAHAIYPPLRGLFTRYAPYYAASFAGFGLAFYAVERLGRRLSP